VVAQALGLLALWLSWRWQVRQEKAHARAVTDLIEALHAGGEVGVSTTGARNGQGEHG
jgi:hypothetical protein